MEYNNINYGVCSYSFSLNFWDLVTRRNYRISQDLPVT